MLKPDKKIAGDETVHYVSAREKRVKPKAKMQPPLTPMIDVTSHQINSTGSAAKDHRPIFSVAFDESFYQP